jgi:hypothetical protein
VVRNYFSNRYTFIRETSKVPYDISDTFNRN